MTFLIPYKALGGLGRPHRPSWKHTATAGFTAQTSEALRGAETIDLGKKKIHCPWGSENGPLTDTEASPATF